MALICEIRVLIRLSCRAVYKILEFLSSVIVWCNCSKVNRIVESEAKIFKFSSILTIFYYDLRIVSKHWNTLK